jgi:hypothetical protein
MKDLINYFIFKNNTENFIIINQKKNNNNNLNNKKIVKRKIRTIKIFLKGM